MRGIAACGMCARCTAHRYHVQPSGETLSPHSLPRPRTHRTEVRAGVVLDVAFGVCETESGKLYLDFHRYCGIYICYLVSVAVRVSIHYRN